LVAAPDSASSDSSVSELVALLIAQRQAFLVLIETIEAAVGSLLSVAKSLLAGMFSGGACFTVRRCIAIENAGDRSLATKALAKRFK